MKQCPEGREKDDSKPCLQIYYTLDGSDPLSALPGATREAYQAAKGLSLGTGTTAIYVSAVYVSSCLSLLLLCSLLGACAGGRQRAQGV